MVLVKNFERSLVPLLVKEFEKRQPVFQVLTGPRQVGKTTIAQVAATGRFRNALTPSTGICRAGSFSVVIRVQPTLATTNESGSGM